MNTKLILFGLSGFILGTLLTLGGIYKASPRLMIIEDESPLNHVETVQAIIDTAQQNGWSIPKTYDLQKTMSKHGHKVAPVTVIELCQPQHAAKVLSDPDSRNVTPMMPCRVSVYETDDKRIIVSRMNTGLVSKVFNENVSKVMKTASVETEAIISEALYN